MSAIEWMALLMVNGILPIHEAAARIGGHSFVPRVDVDSILAAAKKQRRNEVQRVRQQKHRARQKEQS